jgi:hypothetical protein
MRQDRSLAELDPLAYMPADDANYDIINPPSTLIVLPAT